MCCDYFLNVFVVVEIDFVYICTHLLLLHVFIHVLLLLVFVHVLLLNKNLAGVTWVCCNNVKVGS